MGTDESKAKICKICHTEAMDTNQCWNDQPYFGLPAVTPETAGYNIIRVLNCITLNYIILYNICIVYNFKYIYKIIIVLKVIAVSKLKMLKWSFRGTGWRPWLKPKNSEHSIKQASSNILFWQQRYDIGCGFTDTVWPWNNSKQQDRKQMPAQKQKVL